MTSGQRKAHVVMWAVLGPVAIVGLALALIWRPPQPVQDGPLPGAAPVEGNAQRDGEAAQLREALP